jgi:hypothetical protein
LSTAQDVLEVVFPAGAALAGGYWGVRWQSRSEAEVELRTVLDDALGTLQGLDERLDASMYCYWNEPRDSTEMTARNLDALAALDEERKAAERIRDRVMVRTEPDTPLHEHFAAALAGVSKARDEMVIIATPRLRPETIDGLASGAEVLGGLHNFDDEREQFRAAVQSRRTPPGNWRRLRARLKRQKFAIERDPTSGGR